MVIGIVAIVLGYVFENQNVAFMVGLAFAVAASLQLPRAADEHDVEGLHHFRRHGGRVRRASSAR